MKHVVDHVNYSGDDCSGGFDDVGDHDDNDNNDNDSGEDGELFWKRQFDPKKLLVCVIRVLNMYHGNYMYKEHCIVFIQHMYDMVD
jgi:hypothetical protein